MTGGELFAGIGGFGLAVQRAGARVLWCSEIDPFAQRVYAERFPDVRQLGDVTKIMDPVPVDLITAGFPCQDLSIAGKRKGLVGERSGLFWEIVRIAGRLRPRWLLLENVPGLLSSHKGRDFETVLAALDELGYGVAWRVLDAQFFGVPQRRRRVFIVGHLGAECPAEVLFEPEGVPGDSQKGRAAGEAPAYCLGTRSADGRNERGDNSANLQLAKPLGSHHRRDDLDSDTYVIQERAVSEGESGPDGKGWRQGAAFTLEARHHTQAVVSLTTQPAGSSQGIGRGGPVVEVAHSLTGEGFDAGEDGTGRGTPLVASVVSNGDAHSGFRDEHGIIAGTVRTHRRNNSNPITEARELVGVRPRRLTPREYERLQGFPDDWTLIEGASDSARYRALGNAVAVPCVEWILRRLVAVDAALYGRKAA